MPNNLYIRRAVSPLNSRMTYIYVVNSVLKFGGILFAPIRLTVVAHYASGPMKVRLFRQEPECTPSTSWTPPQTPTCMQTLSNCAFFPSD